MRMKKKDLNSHLEGRMRGVMNDDFRVIPLNPPLKGEMRMKKKI
jgi:hypothetical protein